MPAHDLVLFAGCSQVFDYEVISGEEDTLKITFCEKITSDVVIPDSISGTTVTDIGAGSFGSRYVSVTVPASVTNIEDGAFADPGSL